MKRFVIIAALVIVHLLAFEALVRVLDLREFGYVISLRDIILICCVPFAIPTIPALLETRLVTFAVGSDKLERLEKGVYPVDAAAGLLGIALGAATLMLVEQSALLWPLLVAVMLGVMVLSGWAKYDILRKKLNGGAKKSLGMAVFGGNMLASALFLGAWLFLITQKVLS